MLNIKSILSLVDVNQIVNTVTTLCFVDGEYCPENKIPAEKLAKIAICTNYFEENPTEEIKLQDFYEKFFADEDIKKLVYDIDCTLNSAQNGEMKTAISNKIEFKKQEIINTLNNDIANSLMSIGNTFDTITDTFNIINTYASGFAEKSKDVNISDLVKNIPEIVNLMKNKNDFAKATIENFKNTNVEA